jgi:hypothetical protein
VWFDGQVDGPVEIELEGDDEGRRGRRRGERRVGHRDHDRRAVEDAAEAAGEGSGAPVLVDLRSSRVVAVAAAACVLLIVAFALGRAAGSESSPPATQPDPTADDLADEAPDTAATAPDDDPSLETLPVPGASDGNDATASDEAGSEPAATSAEPTDTLPPVRITELGGPLLPVPTGLVVVGLTIAGDLIEIDLDSGAVRSTTLENVRSFGNPPFVTALRDATIVGAPPGGPNEVILVVPLGGVGSPAPSEVISDWGRIPRGPAPNEIWTPVPDDGPYFRRQYARFDLSTGEQVGDVLELALQSILSSDGHDGLVVQTFGGVYEVFDQAPQRVSTGQLVATGVSHFVVIECDERLDCDNVRIDRQTGERTSVVFDDRAVAGFSGPARVAPDGSVMVGFEPWRVDAETPWVLTDLSTGESVLLPNASPGGWGVDSNSSLVWTDDSRFLVHLDGGRLAAYDRDSGDSTDLLAGFALDDDIRAIDVRPAAERLTPFPASPPTQR